MFSRAPLERTGDGFRLRLAREESALLDRLATELDAVLEDGRDPALGRLFPDAYEDDDDAAAEYRALVGGDLRAERRAAAAALRRTLAGESVGRDELDAALRAVNDLRLLLGTRLGVTEELYEEELDPRDPRAPELAVFFYLTWLQERMVLALESPPPER